MTKRENFIAEITTLMNSARDCQEMLFEELSSDALEYFEELKSSKETVSKAVVGVTEKGKPILKYMQENCESFNNAFKSKNIADGLFISSRIISGSLRKLVTDGYIEKISDEGVSPIVYAVTSKGLAEDLTN